MYFVEEPQGAYGIILLTNLQNFLKGDMLWYFSIYLQLEDLLLDEAQALWLEKHGEG